MTITLTTLERRLLADGFRPGTPARVAHDTRTIDREALGVMICPGCGREDMTYALYHKGRVYVVAAVCDRCGTAEEF